MNQERFPPELSASFPIRRSRIRVRADQAGAFDEQEHSPVLNRKLLAMCLEEPTLPRQRNTANGRRRFSNMF